MPDKRTELVTRIAALQRELAALETRPEEPTGGNPVVAFVVTFPGGSGQPHHHYAARKAHGQWSSSGTPETTRRRYTWDELLDWIDANNTGGLAASNLALLQADRVLV